MSSVTDLYYEVSACRTCQEFSSHYKFAPGCHGKGGKQLMIVGESSHKPSIDAGRYYDQGSVRWILADVIDLDRDCFLSDTIKCDKQYCSKKGKSLDKIAERCATRFLIKEFNLLKPQAIIAVGRIAFEFLTGNSGSFASRQSDGTTYYEKTSRIPVYPVIHPSYANMFYGLVPWQNVPYNNSFIDTVRRALNN